jgi:hypothetical protein
MSIVQKLTEGIVNRDLSAEGAALISKWENTGLLEGLENDKLRDGMARLLENQAKELLRESSSMSGGDVEGFAAVAFPLVRRVFGNLIANDLVSVQPMSLPSGLIFFLDFTISADWGLEGSADIPEIDIKVDSVAVTAITKKLKAKWTPELGQDLNAYHNLDAEVELTQILSEQIALEIDRRSLRIFVLVPRLV